MNKAKDIALKILLLPLKCFSWIVAISLLLCYTAIYISPAKFWPFAYFGLAFQLFFILNIALLILWAITKQKLFKVHLIALFPSIFFVGSFVGVFGRNSSLAQGYQPLKVVSYNIQMFQLPFKKADSTFLDIAIFLNEEKPDIVCLQEFYTASGKLTEEQFRSILKGLDHYYIYYNVRKKDSNYGIATFSRYPIKMQVEIPFENTANVAMYTDIDVKGTIVRVYNVHLQSVKLNLRKSLGRILGNQDEKRIDELESVSTRLRTAFVKRSMQVDDVAQHVKVSPYPVILCGDFNDMPVSYTYRKVRGDMKDTFREAGRGIPSTYHGFFPSFRIDYIFHHQDMRTLSYNVAYNAAYSDHYPVVAEIGLPITGSNEE